MALTQVQGGLLESGAALNNIGAGGITPSYLSTQSQYTGFKNRLINGDMTIDQRNVGASVSVSNGTVTYITDRWNIYEDTSGSVTAQQSTTAPAGFINSFLATVTSAGTSTSNQLVRIQQRIEGFNIADLGWGTANAQPVAISFWVRSSLTGTYCVSIRNGATDRSYVTTYAINSANTYEYKTVIIPGDTSGTWLTNNGRGMIVDWDLGSGSTYNTTAGSWVAADRVRTSAQENWIGTSGATFFLTGCQLEKGSVATSYDYLDYGRELMLCQRYYTTNNFANPGAFISAAGVSVYTFETYKVTMRATPTVTTTLCQSQASAGSVTNRTFNLSNNNANGFSPQLATSDPLCYITYQANIEL